MKEYVYFFEDTNPIEEAVTYKRVVRRGKIIRKPIAPKGYRIKRVHGKPVAVRMTASQHRKMSIIAKRSARKRKSKIRQTLRKRRMSIRKRSSFGKTRRHKR